MGKRGPKPQGKTKVAWSADMAYAIGLIVTDGSLSKSGRHINFTSKDLELIGLFQKSLDICHKISKKFSGHGSWAYQVQFSDVLFYKFLESVGLMQRKSKIIGKVKVPRKYFFDFLRGHHDGDGTFYSYYDPRWKSSFMFYLVFLSASKKHIDWIRKELQTRLGVRGHVTGDGRRTVYQLKYAKKESMKILQKMYYSKNVSRLSRKYLKIQKAFSIVGESI